MEYSFDKVIDRRGSGCIKWDYNPEVLPMWVADMDFETPPFIMEALRRRLEHGVFGYTMVQPEYYEAIINWFGKRRGWSVDKSWIIYTTGVIPALSAVIKAFTSPGDKVLINTPSYNHFYSSIRNNGCEVAASPLRYSKEGDTLRYGIDWEDLDAKLADPKVKVFLFCNPQNPTGRIWNADELAKVGEICRRHGKPVISDEIHCEIEMPGYTFVPFASVNPENCACSVTLNSCSKSFNLAGLQIANIISPDEKWRKAIDRAINVNENCDVNPFGPVALQACYSDEGAVWLKEMCAYVHGNYKLLKETLAAELPGFTASELQGTYLAWVDCHRLINRGISSKEIEEQLKEVEKVWIMAGETYGDGNFIRINLAAPRSMFEEGLQRIISGLKRLSR